MAESSSSQKMPASKPQTHRKKLARLPPNAKVHKRPLLRPQIASPYSNAQQQKIIYISAQTPFLSAVKRAEKLLHLSEKRLIQSATTIAKQSGGKRKRGGADEILDIAETVEAQKSKKRKVDGVDGAGEEVLFKGTGKAIQKVLELALWFQQREEYAVRLRTGTVGAVDDIEVEEDAGDDAGAGHDPAAAAATNQEGDPMDTTAGAEDSTRVGAAADVEIRPDNDDGSISKAKRKRRKGSRASASIETPPETRIRYTSVLEVAVSLR